MLSTVHQQRSPGNDGNAVVGVLHDLKVDLLAELVDQEIAPVLEIGCALALGRGGDLPVQVGDLRAEIVDVSHFALHPLLHIAADGGQTVGGRVELLGSA